MDIILANVGHLHFKLEKDLLDQVGAVPLPFCGMDKSMAAVCQFLNSKYGADCEKGSSCPFRHIRGDRTIVCKHWLRGLCKKGDQCEFLHEYDMKKMPECYFYSRFNACHNKECPFLHIDPESKVRDCPWYDRGFCRHGPHCRHRHVRRVLCINYLAGFCPNGWSCKYMHPRFELPPISDTSKDQTMRKLPACHICGELGHKASVCKKNLALSGNESNNFHLHTIGISDSQNRSDKTVSEGKEDSDEVVHAYTNVKKNTKPLEEITCYKCGQKGHYANRCPKGHLAFLSNHRSHK